MQKGQAALTVPCCMRCNLAKGVSSIEEFRANTPFPLRDGLFYGEAMGLKMKKLAADRRGFNSLMADRLTAALQENVSRG